MSQVDKVNLLGLSPAKLEAFFAGLGEKRFRAQQVLAVDPPAWCRSVRAHVQSVQAPEDKAR